MVQFRQGAPEENYEKQNKTHPVNARFRPTRLRRGRQGRFESPVESVNRQKRKTSRQSRQIKTTGNSSVFLFFQSFFSLQPKMVEKGFCLLSKCVIILMSRKAKTDFI